ncbi:hypothetical protein D3C84_842120 [compost metagenome]
MQFTRSLGGLTHLRRRRAAAGNLVRMMATEQAPISTLDLRRLSGGRHPQKPQCVLITGHAVAQWPFPRLIVVRQRLHLMGRPAQPFAPLADQFTFTAAGTTIGPDHSPAGA